MHRLLAKSRYSCGIRGFSFFLSTKEKEHPKGCSFSLAEAQDSEPGFAPNKRKVALSTRKTPAFLMECEGSHIYDP